MEIRYSLPFGPFWDKKKLSWVTADALLAYQDLLYRKKQVEEIRDQTYRRGFDLKGWTASLEELATYTQNRMKAANYLLVGQLPSFLHMMKRAGLSPSTSPLLAEQLTPSGSTSCSLSASLPPEPTLFVPNTPLVRSLTGRSLPSQQAINFDTFSRVVDASLTPTPSEDFGVFTATPLDIGPPTMTEVVDQFMEDLLTQEFSPVVLAEDS